MTTRGAMPVSQSEQLSFELEDLRQNALRMFLMCLLGVPFLWMMLVIRLDYYRGPLDYAALVLVTSPLVVLKLQKRNYAAACWAFLACGMTAEGLAIMARPTPQVMAFGVLVVIAANALLGARHGLVAGILTWGVVAAVANHQTGIPVTHGVLLSTLVLYGVTWFGGWLAVQPLETFALWAVAAWTHSQELLTETQTRKAELYRALRALEEATHRIERMNNELVLAQREAEEARSLKAKLVATVSHELRNPLNLIVGFSELMALHPESYGEPLPNIYYSDVDAIYRNSQHLVSLIDDVLDLSRIEAQSLPLAKETLNVADILQEVAAAVRPLAERRGLYIKEQFSPALPALIADPIRLRQVFSNVVTNALRYTENGGITLHAQCRSQEVLISVEDTGTGIATEDVPRLFKEFNTLGRARSQGLAGTGLGLSISKQLIELHGGRIWVESAKGVGTKVSCMLPVCDVAPSEGQSRPRTQRSPAPAPCLVIHDDPSIVRVLARHVSAYPMIGVTGSREIASVAQEASLSAIITTPGEAISAQDELARIGITAPVIALELPSITRQWASTGVIGYLTKPVTAQMLQAMMRRFDSDELTILLVDDDPDFVRLMEDLLMLLPRPYRVMRAYSGQQACERMQSFVPDVVFMDLVMPEMSGEQVIEWMQRKEHLKVVPIVIVSANDLGDDHVYARSPLSIHFEGTLTMGKTVRLLQAALEELSHLSREE